MKIWGNIPRVSGIYNNTGKIDKTHKVDETSSVRDKVTISGIAKEYNIAINALKQVPDIRQDKINDIMQRMENKTYSVSSADIAEKIINQSKKV